MGQQNLITSFIWIHITCDYSASATTDMELLKTAKDLIYRGYWVSSVSETKATVAPVLSISYGAPLMLRKTRELK
ncbi:uncharacterized protein N7443_004679 [Penicillium atrosanguineum]|uniref:Uncharacterized protein n=1 Tax=Penicillium atrosanguineum TaxID=1132637 RepID=A0A9W9U878_9EURO|nr:uncharacterized protein N7443_004679 [Penicillium atrosanguineum]KAJ5133697.1 hypothetical protein N7526_005062 [Penicillium atrosanguineum]KAJ5305019.1 hypothetical protein N7443_004679 [Penicillium atrosanguineum]KAJ5324485.1 hypothetical protein N7476_003085 [Penicillium atrosanguineum]